MTDLNTFGAIMSHAIALESQITQYYRDQGNEARAAETDKRRLNLERVRRENVVEIQLEPIDDLYSEDYPLDTSTPEALEASAAHFYSSVAPKIKAREAARALEKAAKQHRELA